MGVFDGHEALHDIYPEVNYGPEKMVAHKVGKVKRRSVTSAASAITPAAGLLLAGAAVVVLGLTGMATFELDLNDVTRTTANIDALSDLGFSDEQYPLEYRLYRVEVNEAPGEDGTVYEDIMDDPRPVAEKYGILEVVETGEITGPEEHLSFRALTPGTDYLLLLYRDGEAEDVTEAYDIEMHFKTLGSGGGPAPPPAPTPPPTTDPEPGTDPDSDSDPEPIYYIITFENEDGTELSSAEYEEGTKAANIVLPDTPTKADDDKFTYTFEGWTPEIADVKGDATYTATYTSKAKVVRYTVKFVDWDGTVISSKQYNAGTRAAYVTVPDEPTREADNDYYYYFMGWEPEAISDVTGNATYTAQYATEERPKYSVTFYDWDGTTVLAEKDYAEGTSAATVEAEAPTPSRADSGGLAYIFMGWEPGTFEDVYDDLEYTAIYEEHSILTVSIAGVLEGYRQFENAGGTVNPGGGEGPEGEISFGNNTFFTELVAGSTPSDGVGAVTVTFGGAELTVNPDDADWCDLIYDGDYISGLSFRNPDYLYSNPGLAPNATLAVTVTYLDEGTTRTATASTSIPLSTMSLPGFTIEEAGGVDAASAGDTFSMEFIVQVDVGDLGITNSGSGNFIDDVAATGGSVRVYAYGDTSLTGTITPAIDVYGDYSYVMLRVKFTDIPMSYYDETDPSETFTIVINYYFEDEYGDNIAKVHNVQSRTYTFNEALDF